MIKLIVSCALTCIVMCFFIVAITLVGVVAYKIRTSCSWKTALKYFNVY